MHTRESIAALENAREYAAEIRGQLKSMRYELHSLVNLHYEAEDRVNELLVALVGALDQADPAGATSTAPADFGSYS
jgi:hypothetical protein